MEYIKEKAEAIKVLFNEVLEINENLAREKSNKEIQFEINGGNFPDVVVRFWNWDQRNNPEEIFEISLDSNHERGGRRHDIHALALKLKEWGKSYGTSRKEDGGAF